METAITKLNLDIIYPATSKTHSISLNSEVKNSIQNIYSKKVINNNASINITINRVINYNNSNGYMERRVIDMNDQVQSEVDRIIRSYRNIHLGLFLFSTVVIALSWAPNLLDDEIGLILKPLSIAFSLMIVLNYYLRRIK